MRTTDRSLALTSLGIMISLLVFAWVFVQPTDPLRAHRGKLDRDPHGRGILRAFCRRSNDAPGRWVGALLAPGSVTSAFAPSLLPGLVVLPIALGWVLNQAIIGSMITSELGVDLFALLSVLFLTVVAWRTGVIANRLGRNLERRDRLEGHLRRCPRHRRGGGSGQIRFPGQHDA